MTMHLAVLTFAIASACAPIGAPTSPPTPPPTPPSAAPAPAASSSQSSSEVPAITIVSPKDQSGVLDLRGRTLAEAQAVAGVDSLDAAPNQRNLRQHSDVLIGGGDFVLRATIVIDEFSGRGAAIAFDGGTVNLDDKEWGAVLTGKLFGGGRFPFETERPASALPGAPIEVEISRYEGSLAVKLNEFEIGRIGMTGFALGRVGFDLAAGNMRVLECTAEGDLSRFPVPRALYSSADGDIDEHRDPSFATDGTRALVTAIAVRTADDGRTIDSVIGRFVDSSGSMSDPHAIDLGGGSVELATIGFATSDQRPWKMLVQFANGKRIAERLTAFDSVDGRAFSKVAEIDCKNSPIRLLTGSMMEFSGLLRSGATVVRDNVVRAAEVRFTSGQGWSVVELMEAPSCEPLYLQGGVVMVRAPKSMDRSLLRDGKATPVIGYEGGASAGGVLYERGDLIRIAQAEAAFPYPMHELVSADRGASWSKARTIWGGSASNASGLSIGDRHWLVFEGGDKARREHVLLLRLSTGEANPPLAQKAAVAEQNQVPSVSQPSDGSPAKP
ncbi:MAG: hypothetical protein RIT24_3032 [Planctomycetota bacterium]|jgi:hypothetical protein